MNNAFTTMTGNQFNIFGKPRGMLQILAFIILIFTFLQSCVKDDIVAPEDYQYKEFADKHPSKHRLLYSVYRQDLINNAPPGPYGFRVGWRDGCDTGIASTGGNFYKSFVSPRKDYNMMKQDPDYSVGWSNAFWYCSRWGEMWHFRGEGRYRGLM
jgi:hypothetical protein